MRSIYFITPLVAGVFCVWVTSFFLRNALGLVIPALALIFSVITIVNNLDEPERKKLGWYSLGGTVLSIGIIAVIIFSGVIKVD